MKIFGKIAYYKILQYEHYIMYLLMFLSITGMFTRIIGTGVHAVYGIIVEAVLNIVGLFI